MEVKIEYGNIIHDDGTITMRQNHVFEDAKEMMHFFKNTVPHLRNIGDNWEVNRMTLTITRTTWVKALEHYDAIVGEEE